MVLVFTCAWAIVIYYLSNHLRSRELQQRETKPLSSKSDLSLEVLAPPHQHHCEPTTTITTSDKREKQSALKRSSSGSSRRIHHVRTSTLRHSKSRQSLLAFTSKYSHRTIHKFIKNMSISNSRSVAFDLSLLSSEVETAQVTDSHAVSSNTSTQDHSVQIGSSNISNNSNNSSGSLCSKKIDKRWHWCDWCKYCVN